MSSAPRDLYIEMVAGNETYAIGIRDIQEIIKMQPITEIPVTLPYIKGVINLRGSIIPVVHLGSLFGYADLVLTKATRIVVIKHRETFIGIIVDQANKVSSYDDIHAPPDWVGSVRGAHFTGIGHSEGQLVGILNLNELLL